MNGTMLSSPTVLPYEQLKNFQFFDCDTIEEVVDATEMMLRHVSRSSLLFAYKVGSLANPARLKSKFGITLGQLAEMLGVSTTTLRRYRAMNELVTMEQLEMLVEHRVSINAVLLVASTMDHSPDIARNVFDALCRGETVTVKDVQANIAQELKSRLLLYNNYPGGLPNEQQQTLLEQYADEVKALPAPEETVVAELVDAVSVDSEATPEEKIMDADIEDPDADEFDDDLDEDVSEESKQSDVQKAQSLKEAEAFYKLVHTALLPLRRNLHDVSENLIAQLEKSEEHEGVILGAEEVHDKYRTDMLDLARDCQSALEALIKAQLWFKRGGYVEKAVECPEGQTFDTIFSKSE